MKRLLTITFLLFVTVGQSQTSGQLLKRAFKKKSTDLLEQFFQEWHQENQPISKIELSKLNDTIKQTYLVFTKFYKPLNIDSLGGSEWGNDIYKNTKFLIIQNFIKIYFTDKLYYTEQEVDNYVVNYINRNIKDDSTRQKLLRRTEGKLSKSVLEHFGPNQNVFFERNDTLIDSIINFRPQIECSGKQPLYLNKKYNEILNAFLGNKHLPLGTGGIMNPARSKGQSKKRKKFLEKYIKIWYGHWGGYWQLISYPKAYAVTFDKEMKYARIDFRMVYEGGEAILKRENDKWILISSKRTWIE